MTAQWIRKKLFGAQAAAALAAKKSKPRRMDMVHLEDRITPTIAIGVDPFVSPVNEGSNLVITGTWLDDNLAATGGLSFSNTLITGGSGSFTDVGVGLGYTSSQTGLAGPFRQGIWSYTVQAIDGTVNIPTPPAKFTFDVKATNDKGQSSPFSSLFQFGIQNVNPSVTGTYSQFALTGVPMDIDLGTIFDPGPIDAPWTVDLDMDGDTVYETLNFGGGYGVLGPIGTQTFTYPTAGVYTANVKVTDKDGGIGIQSITVTVADDVSPTFVNDNWLISSDIGAPGLSLGDKVSNPLETYSGTYIFGFNAFDSFNVAGTAGSIGALNATTAGGVVNVNEGNYTENLTLAKAVTINGAQAGVSAVGRVGPESLIAGSITINASNSTVDGLQLSSGGVAGVTDFGALATVNNTVIQNNIIAMTAPGFGVELSGKVGAGTPSTGNVVHQNAISGALTGINVGGVNGNASAQITDNEVSASDEGIFVGGHTVAGTVVISGNTVTTPAASSGGIILDGLLAGALSGPYTVSGNQVTTVAGGNVIGGIVVSNVNSPVALTNNDVDGGDRGINIGATGGETVAISGGTVDGTDTGIRVGDQDPYSSTFDSNTTVTVAGTAVSNYANGLYVQDATLGNTVLVTVGGTGTSFIGGVNGVYADGSVAGAVTVNFSDVTTVTNNTAVGSAWGVYYDGFAAGSVAKVTFDSASDNDSDLYIGVNSSVTISNTVGSLNSFGGTDYFIENYSPNDYTLTNYDTTEFEGLEPDNVYQSPTFLDDNFRIEDLMYHGPDATTSGVITWNADTLYVSEPFTGNSDESIQNAHDVASSGFTIYVEEGTYLEDVSVTTPQLTFRGAFWGVDPNDSTNRFNENPNRSGFGPESYLDGSFNVFDPAEDTTIDGFYIYGSGPNGALVYAVDTNGVDLIYIDNLTVINNRLDTYQMSTTEHAVSINGLVTSYVEDVQVTNNRINSTGAGGNNGIVANFVAFSDLGSDGFNENAILNIGGVGIQLNSNDYVNVYDNAISGMSTGILVDPSTEIEVIGNTIKNSTTAAIVFDASEGVVSGNTLTNFDLNATGVLVTNGSVVDIDDSDAANVISGFEYGVDVQDASSEAYVYNNTIFDNTTGVRFGSFTTGDVYGNNFDTANPYDAGGAPYVPGIGSFTELETDGTATNNTLATAEVVSSTLFGTPTVNVDVADPTVTIFGRGAGPTVGDVDFYQFNFGGAGTLTLDMDNNPFAFDTIVTLLNSSGTVLAADDDSFSDAGSASSLDSLLSYSIPSGGVYYVAVSRYSNFLSDGNPPSDVQGTTPYRMEVSFSGNLYPRTPGDNFTDLRIESDAGLVDIGNATAADRNIFGGDLYFISTSSTQDHNLVGHDATNFEGYVPATKNDNYRIEDHMFHAPDQGASIGLIQWNAGQIYVSAPGTTPPQSDETINFAVLGANSGDTINVEAGSYTENVVVGTSVTILGAGSDLDPVGPGRTAGSAAESVINVPAGNGFLVTASNVTISGFDIVAPGTSGVGIYLNTTNGTASKNFVHGFTSNVGVAADSAGFSIARNNIYNNGTNIYLAGATVSGSVSRNELHNAVGTGPTWKGSAIDIEGAGISSSVTVADNNIYSNHRGVFVLNTVTSLTGLTVVNNSFTSNTKNVENAGTGSMDADGNWWGSSAEATINGSMIGTVDFSTYLWSGTNTLAPVVTGIIGFNGDTSDLGVTTLGAQIGGSGRINEAIDFDYYAPAGGDATLVRVNAGTYSEAADLDRTVEVRALGNLVIGSIEGAASGAVLATNGKTVQVGSNNGTTSYAGSITSDTGSVFIKEGSGNLTLSGASSGYAGTTNVTNGTLTVTGSLGGSGSVSAGATMTVSGTFGTAGKLLTVDGTANGTGGTYAGDVTVTGGGLLNGSGAVGGTVQVDALGTIRRTGTIGGDLNVLGDIDLAGTGTAGAQVVTGTLNLGGSANYLYDLGATNAASDRIQATSTTITGGATTFTPNVIGVPVMFTTLTPIDNTSGTALSGSFSVPFTDNNIVTIGGNFYQVQYNFGGGTDYQLIRVPSATPPGTVYVNDEWDGLGVGTTVDVNPNLGGLQPGTIGWDAFARPQEGVDQAGLGLVNIYAGNYTTTLTKGDVNLTGGTFRLLNDNFETVGTPRTTVNIDGSLSGTGLVNLNKQTLAVGGTASTSFDGTITATGNLIKQGTGTMTLTGNNTYSGSTTINNGVLQLSPAGIHGVIPDSSSVVVNALGTLDVNGQDETIGSLAGAGSVTLHGTSVDDGWLTTGGNNTNTTFSGVISGNGRLIKTGVGTMTLTGTNTYADTDGDPATASTVVNTGILQIGNGSTLGSVAGDVEVQSGSLAFNRSGVATQAGLLTGGGKIFGTGSVIKNGTGTLQLGSTNTFSGGTIVNRGDLLALNNAQLGDSAGLGTVTVNAPGRVLAVGTFATSRDFTQNAGASIVVVGGQQLTLNGGSVTGGAIYGPGSVAMGGGTVITGTTLGSGLTAAVNSNTTMLGVSNASKMTVAAGETNVLLQAFTNLSGGNVTVNGEVDVDGFTSNGQLNIFGAGSLMTNIGTSDLIFGAGSVTQIGQWDAINGITDAFGSLDLGAYNAHVTGGQFRNNATDYLTSFDFSGGVFGTGTVVLDFGSIGLGLGLFFNTPVTQNGGIDATGSN